MEETKVEIVIRARFPSKQSYKYFVKIISLLLRSLTRSWHFDWAMKMKDIKKVRR